MTPLELMTEVRKLLSDPSRWTPRGTACTADGRVCLPCDPEAVQWSLSGAIDKVADGDMGLLSRVNWPQVHKVYHYDDALAFLDTQIADYSEPPSTPDADDQDDKAELVDEALSDAGIVYERDDVGSSICFSVRRGGHVAEISVDDAGDCWLVLAPKGTEQPIHLPTEDAIRAAVALMGVWTPEHQGE